MNMKLQNKFILMILPILILSTVIISFIIYDYVEEIMTENTHEQTRSQLNIFLESIDKNTEKSLQQYSFISNTNTVKDYLVSSGDTKSINKQRDLMNLFSGISESNNGFKEVYLYDSEGKINFVHSDNYLYDHRVDDYWLNSLIQKSNKKSIISIETSSKGNRLAYTVQILDKSSKVIGYLIGTESFDFIKSWMTVSENKNIIGSLIVHNNNLIEKSGTFNTSALMHNYKFIDINSLNQFITIEGTTGDIGSVLYVKKGKYGITAGVITSNKSFIAIETYLAGITIGMTIFISVFLSFLIYLSFRKLIVVRLEQIKDATRRIAMGDHDIILPDNHKDEIGDLFETFNKMSVDIKVGNEKIHDLAYFDELTGLHNKASFNIALDRMIAQNEIHTENEIAFLSLDLDDFKSINDLHGHHTGDHFLKVVGDRLSSITTNAIKEDEHKHQIFLSRLAGDEFAILIYGKNIKTFSNNLCNRAISIIREQMSFENTEIFPSCSIGMSLYPSQAKNEEELFKYSDIAMYEAKRFGKNQAVPFDEDMIERVIKKEQMCNDIKIAIEHDSFELYLQPKYNVNEKCFNKFESLIRWIDPVKGFISPAVFIPIAEDSNLIVEIGDWVMKQTCKNIRTLEKKGWKDFCVSLNVSPQQLLDGNFARNMERNIAVFGIDSSHIEIEVTEHSFAKNIDFVTRELDAVRRLGVSVALDDFGTGYSSLAYIQKLPLDVVKLDRAFVSKALTCHVNMTIIKSVMLIAEALNIKTVAEGVETIEESELMIDIGVDYIQGFYYFRPMTMGDILSTDFNQRLIEIEEENNLKENNLKEAI